MSAFRLPPRAPGSPRPRRGDLVALVAADGGLDRRVEILHPDRGAGHPRLGQRVEPRASTSFGSISTENSAPGPSGTAAKIAAARSRWRRRQQRRRAAAPVQPRQMDALRQGARQQPVRPSASRHRRAPGRSRAGALRAAGAEPAQPAAERDVQIERDRGARGNRGDPVGETAPAPHRRKTAARSGSSCSAAPRASKSPSRASCDSVFIRLPLLRNAPTALT
jgi:hypothetical protein